jgi:membrane protease subunit (stomatin/prohibitin family)
MGLIDSLRHQFIEILEWLDDSGDALVYRFPVHDQEIKMGAKLVVRENQAALFVNEGKAADLFSPGTYTLATQNVPILSDLRGWKYGFESPFKAEVYFFSTRVFTDFKWGTANPVMMRDQEFGMIRLRAFGTYAMKIADPKTLFSTIVGTQGLTTTEEITGQLRSIILSRLSDSLAESKTPAIDLATRYDELSSLVQQKLQPDFSGFGLALTRFVIENASLPEEVEAAIDQRTRLGVLGDRIGQYAQLQSADAIKIAAANPGGLAGAGAGLGAGMAIGSAMTGALGGMQSAPPPPPPAGAMPPPPSVAAAVWSLAIDGKTYGPYTDDALKGMLKEGRVSPSTLAWKPGAAGWATLESLMGGSAAAPPPPPPPPLPR